MNFIGSGYRLRSWSVETSKIQTHREEELIMLCSFAKCIPGDVKHRLQSKLLTYWHIEISLNPRIKSKRCFLKWQMNLVSSFHLSNCLYGLRPPGGSVDQHNIRLQNRTVPPPLPFLPFYGITRANHPLPSLPVLYIFLSHTTLCVSSFTASVNLPCGFDWVGKKSPWINSTKKDTTFNYNLWWPLPLFFLFKPILMLFG